MEMYEPTTTPRRPSLAALDRVIDGCDADEMLAAIWLERALAGDFQFFRLLIEYRNGPPPRAEVGGSIDLEKLLTDAEDAVADRNYASAGESYDA